MGNGLKAYRIAFHCHSLLSHDSRGSFEEIADAARKVGVDGVILTDHYRPGNMARTPPPAVNGVLFIPGIETRAMGGSMLAFGFANDFDGGLPKAEIARHVETEGGLVVAGHCEQITRWGEIPIDGFEIYNLHAEFSRKSRLAVVWRFFLLFPDAFFESSITFPGDNLLAWDRLLLGGERVFPLLGGDAHANVRILGPLGGVMGTYPEVLRLFSNHVLAPDLRQESILEALRHGRVYCVFDYLGDATGFSVSYGPSQVSTCPGSRAILGDRVAFNPGHTLAIELPREARLRVIRSGVVHREVVGTRFLEALPGPGIYRIEVYLGGDLWILSAPLYVGSGGRAVSQEATGS